MNEHSPQRSQPFIYRSQTLSTKQKSLISQFILDQLTELTFRLFVVIDEHTYALDPHMARGVWMLRNVHHFCKYYQLYNSNVITLVDSSDVFGERFNTIPELQLYVERLMVLELL